MSRGHPTRPSRKTAEPERAEVACSSGVPASSTSALRPLSLRRARSLRGANVPSPQASDPVRRPRPDPKIETRQRVLSCGRARRLESLTPARPRAHGSKTYGSQLRARRLLASTEPEGSSLLAAPEGSARVARPREDWRTDSCLRRGLWRPDTTNCCPTVTPKSDRPSCHDGGGTGSPEGEPVAAPAG